MPAEPALRALRLSRGDLDRFFGLNTGRAIRCEDARGQQRELTVVREDPDFAVLVKRAGKSGISVTVPSGMAAFEGEKRLYVADEHHIFCCSTEDVYKRQSVDSTAGQEKQLYRVRKSWEDTKSQIGAFSSLDNAKKACTDGYSV